MGVEIEKKFLVRNESWRQGVTESIPIRQGYLASAERCAVRVRLAGNRAWLTIKGARVHGAAPEYNYPIPVTDAEMLLCMAERPLIEKTRHLVPHSGKMWEVDEFSGENKGLILAEIELTHTEEPFALPAWAGREVTEYARFYNVRLVNRPYSTWSEEEKR